jgi:hypothetical protein
MLRVPGFATGRLFSRLAPEWRRNHRQRARESGLAGMERKRSLPLSCGNSRPTPASPDSLCNSSYPLLISPGLLFPSRIEMLIRSFRNNRKIGQLHIGMEDQITHDNHIRLLTICLLEYIGQNY